MRLLIVTFKDGSKFSVKLTRHKNYRFKKDPPEINLELKPSLREQKLQIEGLLEQFKVEGEIETWMVATKKSHLGYANQTPIRKWQKTVIKKQPITLSALTDILTYLRSGFPLYGKPYYELSLILEHYYSNNVNEKMVFATPGAYHKYGMKQGEVYVGDKKLSEISRLSKPQIIEILEDESKRLNQILNRRSNQKSARTGAVTEA